MDNHCNDCYFHIAEDCPGEDNIDSLFCFQSIESMMFNEDQLYDKGQLYEGV